MSKSEEANHEADQRSTPNRWRRWCRRFLIGCGIFVLFLVGGELFARYGLGLGDPPLSIADSQIEYMFKPSMSYWRFGNYVHYNAYSMRSEDFPKKKNKPDELRVLMIGDSVINGGNLTDQSQLASKLLEHRLAKDLHRPVVVGNISAGSWGPGNQVAYLKRFGVFDADIAVIVLSSHDYADYPDFKPIVGVSPNYPAHKPISALWEGITRYLPRYLPWDSANSKSKHVRPHVAHLKKNILKTDEACREMAKLLRDHHVRIILAQHLERAEAKTGQLMPGHDHLLHLFQKMHLKHIIQLGPAFRAALSDGEQPYRDKIHPDPLGQKLIAHALTGPIEKLAKQQPSASTLPSSHP